MTEGPPCPHCGRPHGGNSPYFSADFAAYVSVESRLLLRWCFHCRHVLIYRVPILLSLVRIPFLRFKGGLDFDTFYETPIARTEDKRMGLWAAAHLVRMVWNCLNARVEEETGSENPQQAMELALEKLPPREVALMIVVTEASAQLVPLEQQIQEGKYLGNLDLRFGVSMRNWVRASRRKDAADATLRALEGYQPGPTT